MSFVGDIVGGIFQKESAEEQADATRDAARIAAEQFKPFNIAGPLGAFRRTPDGGFAQTLRGEAYDLREQFAGEALGSIDERASQVYGLMSQLSSDDEEQARRTTREALFRSGRLGTSGGIREIGEVERALANARLDRELQSISVANNLRQGAFQNYMTLGLEPARIYGGLAVNRNPAAPVAAQGMINSAYARGAANNAFVGGIGSAIGDLAQQTGVNDWFNDQIGSIFSPSPGVGTSAEFGAFGSVPFDQIGATGIGGSFGGY